MKFHRITLSQEKRDYLATLHDVLASPERRAALAPDLGFGMAMYEGIIREDGIKITDHGTATDPDKRRKLNEQPHVCGTSACAAGWGPLAGIAPPDHVLAYDNTIMWSLYTTWLTDGDDRLSSYLFSGAWSAVDDTPEGAAARIRLALQIGVPMDGDYGPEFERSTYAEGAEFTVEYLW